jgi:hypothetical protein
MKKPVKSHKQLIKEIRALEKKGMDFGNLVEMLKESEKASKRTTKLRKSLGLD